MFNVFDLAYAAGYIDGDGCFYIGTYQSTNSTVYEYSIQVCSVKKESTEWLKEKFGGSIRIKEAKGNRKIPYVWTIKGQESVDFAQALLPYLIEKQPECEIYIEFGLTIIHNDFQPLKDEGILDRAALIKNMRHIRHNEGLMTEKIAQELKIIIGICHTQRDVAYLAGLIDAEGCFRVKKWNVKNKPNPIYTICLEIGNTKKYFFRELLSKFGGSLNYIEAKSDNRRNSAIWTVSAKRLNYLLDRIHSFIKIKKPVCEKIIEFYKTNLPNGGDRHSESFKKRYQDIRQLREQIVSEIHILNAKGHNTPN